MTQILIFRNNTTTAKPEKYYNIVDCKGCREYWWVFHIVSNIKETQPKVSPGSQI
jgi:hypothetical protein